MIQPLCVQNDAYVVRLDRQFSVAAVDKNGEFDLGRAPVVAQCVERRANGATGEQDIVHKNDVRILNGKGNFGALEGGVIVKVLEVIAIERDVKNAERQLAFVFGQQCEQALGDFIATAADTDEGNGGALCPFANGHGKSSDTCGDIVRV